VFVTSYENGYHRTINNKTRNRKAKTKTTTPTRRRSEVRREQETAMEPCG